MTGRGDPEAGSAGPVTDARRGDLEVLSRVIADAFCDLAVSQWLVPDREARRRVFPGYFRILAEHAVDTGRLRTVRGLTAAGLWLPVGEDGPRPPRDYDERLTSAVGPLIGRFELLDQAFEASHPVGLRHVHLAVLAVRPDRQGAGAGTALLRERHRALDRAGLPAYLEASGLDTRRIYLRHGYADHGDPIRLPDGPAMYPMLRPPKPSG